jgi:hypothetical protein
MFKHIYSWTFPSPDGRKKNFRQHLGYLLLALLMLFGQGSVATAQGREFGLRAGVMGALTYNGGEMVEDALASLYGGFYVGRPLGSTFFPSWISGLEYTQYGYMTDDQNFRRLHYLGVPLAVRLHFGPWHLQTGVSANFKFYERWVDNGDDILYLGNRSFWFDLPIQLGGGVKISDVIIEARFHFGWLDVFEGNKNNALQLGLAYVF